MLPIKAVVFDFDGLIIDTETAEYQVWQDIFQEHGCCLAYDIWAGCIGAGTEVFDPYAHLEQLACRPLDREMLRALRHNRHTQLVATMPVLPGVVDYLQAARRLGLGIALASSSTHSWVDGYLAERGLLEYFDHIKCADDVTYTKPAPDLYLAALQTLGVKGREAVAFEDSLNGLQAAKAAGLYCVVVPNPVTRPLPLAEADVIVESLADMPLPDLLAKLEGKVAGSIPHR